jgi:hypothetical protein
VRSVEMAIPSILMPAVTHTSPHRPFRNS